jgi:hypothetical protein
MSNSQPYQAQGIYRFGALRFGTGQFKVLHGDLWLFGGFYHYCWAMLSIPCVELRDKQNYSDVRLEHGPTDRPSVLIDAVAYIAQPDDTNGKTTYFTDFFKLPEPLSHDIERFRNFYAGGRLSSAACRLPEWINKR